MVNLTDFGIFVEVSDGVEGLVHISEIDSTIPKNKVHDMYPVGTVVKANVIKIDLEERRLGLSISEIISTPEPPPPVQEEEANADAEAPVETAEVTEEPSGEVVETEAPVESAQASEEPNEEVAESESDATENTDIPAEVDASENEAEQEK